MFIKGEFTKVIILSFEGGLGNQLFQYAFGRYLEDTFCEDVFYDISNYFYDKREIRDFEIEQFNIKSSWKRGEIYKSRIRRHGLRYLIYLFITAIYLKIDKIFNNNETENRRKIGQIYEYCINFFGFYRIHYNKKYTYLKSCFSKKYVRGQWMRKDIVQLMESSLRNELRVISVPNDEEQKYLNSIVDSMSVAVHIRRGDYVQLGMVTCNINYYFKCMAIMAQKVDNPVFYVFSDDIEWVKKEFETNNDYKKYTIIFVNAHTPTVDLRLMYNCKHFIMSNSTFSWWGAWLGTYPEKIVLTPKKWWPNAQISCEYVMKEWIEVDN